MAEPEYDKEQLRILRNAFKAFDHDGKGTIDHTDVQKILEILGQKLDDKAIKALIKEVDKGNTGKLDFNQFCRLAARFVEVEEDAAALQSELKEAFRVYDKEGKGYLSVQVLRAILHELDDKISNSELDSIIEEIDADGSGTVDFDEFMQVMTGNNYTDLFIRQKFVFEPRHYTTHIHTQRMRLHERIEWHFERFFNQYFWQPSTKIIHTTTTSTSGPRKWQPVHATKTTTTTTTTTSSSPAWYRPVYRPRFPKWVPILTLYRDIVQNPFKRRQRLMITHY